MTRTQREIRDRIRSEKRAEHAYNTVARLGGNRPSHAEELRNLHQRLPGGRRIIRKFLGGE